MTEANPLQQIHGIAASPGITVGRAYVVDRRQMTVSRRHIRPTEVENEVGRLRRAMLTARQQLQSIREKLVPEANEHAVILDAHLLMLDDAILTEQTERAIREECVNAEWALHRTVEHIKELFDQADDEYFRERRSDVDFVGERVLRQLMEAPADIGHMEDMPGPLVLVAHDLSPADTAALGRSDVRAFVTDVGSATSHTAIMARALSLPAVVGAQEATRMIAPGDLLIVDGLTGTVWIQPDDESCRVATERGARYAAFARSLKVNRGRDAMTLDRVRVTLRANIELPAEAAVAIDHGADGIGLYRTEFMYVDRKEPPGEQEQFEVFKRIVETIAPRMVTLRTFDLGGDKFSTAFRVPKELNPALGLRAVRLALRERVFFRAQLRAMLRASAFGNVRVMIPMVSSMMELNESLAEVELARDELRARGQAFGEVPVGIMVETPSAVIMADLLATRAAFFSIGTNDLIQYSLAVDRGNENVAHLARSLDPAIVRSIAMVLSASREAGIPCAMCGAMASEIYALPVLLGLGVMELSVEPTAVPEIKEAIGRVDIARARDLARDAMSMDSADAIEAAVHDRFGEVLSDLAAGGALGVMTDTGNFLLPEARRAKRTIRIADD